MEMLCHILVREKGEGGFEILMKHSENRGRGLKNSWFIAPWRHFWIAPNFAWGKFNCLQVFFQNTTLKLRNADEADHRCSLELLFWEIAENLSNSQKKHLHYCPFSEVTGLFSNTL